MPVGEVTDANVVADGVGIRIDTVVVIRIDAKISSFVGDRVRKIS